MNNLLICGLQIVVLALIFYSIGIFILQRKKIVNLKVLFFISAGVVFDITATGFMIAGSSKGLLTIHGLIGYSALLAMIIDCVLLWQYSTQNEKNLLVSRSILIYSRYAFAWWVVAFISGGLLSSL